MVLEYHFTVRFVSCLTIIILCFLSSQVFNGGEVRTELIMCIRETGVIVKMFHFLTLQTYMNDIMSNGNNYLTERK